MTYENEYTEFKTLVTNDLYKEVVAFANTDGGTIHIGVDDFGNKIGVSDIDGAYIRITNGIRDAIAPDVTMFCKYSIIENIIKIEVSEGSRKPYYLKSKGDLSRVEFISVRAHQAHRLPKSRFVL